MIGYFGSAYFIPLLVSPAGSNLFEAIRSRLKAQVSLAALTEVYNNRPKSGAVFPYLIVSRINASQEMNTGPDYQYTPEYQFTVLANDDETAESLGVAAYSALLPNTNNPPLQWNDGAETIRLPLFDGRLQEQPGRDKQNRNVWAYTFGYRILTVRNR